MPPKPGEAQSTSASPTTSAPLIRTLGRQSGSGTLGKREPVSWACSPGFSGEKPMGGWLKAVTGLSPELPPPSHLVEDVEGTSTAPWMMGPSHFWRGTAMSLQRTSTLLRKPAAYRKWLSCPSRSEVKRGCLHSSGPHLPTSVFLTPAPPWNRRRMEGT